MLLWAYYLSYVLDTDIGTHPPYSSKAKRHIPLDITYVNAVDSIHTSPLKPDVLSCFPALTIDDFLFPSEYNFIVMPIIRLTASVCKLVNDAHAIVKCTELNLPSTPSSVT